MANQGTAVCSIWDTQTEKTMISNAKQENVNALSQDEKFRMFFKEATEKSIVVSSNSPINKVTTMATLVSNLSSLVGSAGTATNQGMVTSFISSRTHNISSSNVNLSKSGITQTQPLLLPKPNIQQKQIIPTTPTKIGYTPNPSVLTSPLHGSPSQSWHSGSPLNRKRIRTEFESDIYDSKLRRTPNRCGPEKGGKGLRHFSMKVCEKVQQKGITSYNEVADELVQEFSEQTLKNPLPIPDQSYDQKNIRRRVYDALNVLMAMNIISKEKKEIKWVGLPTNSAQECKHLEDQKTERIERIRQKQQQLKELIVQQIAYKNLVERNKKVEKKTGPPQANACIHLPFIIVNTSKKTVIDCSISSDKSEYLFNFDEAFEIHDDIEVLKRMGLSYGLEKGAISDKDLKSATTMVPKALESCVLQMGTGTYGDIDLIELDRGGRRSTSPQTETFTSSVPSVRRSPGPSHKISARKRIMQSSTSAQISKVARTYASQSSVGSDYDTDNDGDDENSSVME